MGRRAAGDICYLPEVSLSPLLPSCLIADVSLQDDVHMPNLTVRETLNFAAASRTPAAGGRVGTRQEVIDDTRDVLVTLFGLRHTLNTKGQLYRSQKSDIADWLSTQLVTILCEVSLEENESVSRLLR